jgi:hypothetical protein
VWLTSWAGVGLEASFAFGPSFYWTQGISDNFLSYGMYLFRDTYNITICLAIVHGLAPGSITAS